MYSCAEYDKKSVEQILPTQVLLPFSNVTFVFGKVVEAKKKTAGREAKYGVELTVSLNPIRHHRLSAPPLDLEGHISRCSEICDLRNPEHVFHRPSTLS
jgi:hypothetical protein